MPRRQYLLTTSLPAGDWLLRHIDLGEVFALVDHINLMAYDFFGPWSTTSGHHAALFPPAPDHISAHAAVQYIFSNNPDIDKKKLLLGIPCYGRTFPAPDSEGHSFLSGNPAIEDRAIQVHHLPLEGMHEQVNLDTATAQCVAPDGSWISYDNTETVAVKARYVKNMGMGGLAFWEATQDRPEYERSLVAAGYRELVNRN
jgi:chitinase